MTESQQKRPTRASLRKYLRVFHYSTEFSELLVIRVLLQQNVNGYLLQSVNDNFADLHVGHKFYMYIQSIHIQYIHTFTVKYKGKNFFGSKRYPVSVIRYPVSGIRLYPVTAIRLLSGIWYPVNLISRTAIKMMMNIGEN